MFLFYVLNLQNLVNFLLINFKHVKTRVNFNKQLLLDTQSKCMIYLILDIYEYFMDLNARKELFSVAYLRALCSQAGVNNGDYEVDDDSVDVTLTKKGRHGAGRVYSPKLDVQLKCTSQTLPETVVDFTFRLGSKNYNELRVTDSSAPRVLIVLRVPEDPLNWVVNGADDILLRNSAYWFSLRGLDPIATDATNLIIPKVNRLTTAELNRIFDIIGSGENL